MMCEMCGKDCSEGIYEEESVYCPHCGALNSAFEFDEWENSETKTHDTICPIEDNDIWNDEE